MGSRPHRRLGAPHQRAPESPPPARGRVLCSHRVPGPPLSVSLLKNLSVQFWSCQPLLPSLGCGRFSQHSKLKKIHKKIEKDILNFFIRTVNSLETTFTQTHSDYLCVLKRFSWRRRGLSCGSHPGCFGGHQQRAC